MPEAHFPGKTLDDVMHDVIKEIQAHGHRIKPTKGEAVELTGVLLKVTDPRARLSRTETRGKLFSCLGELCWYLANSKDLVFISYYILKYRESADGGEIFGGYCTCSLTCDLTTYSGDCPTTFFASQCSKKSWRDLSRSSLAPTSMLSGASTFMSGTLAPSRAFLKKVGNALMR